MSAMYLATDPGSVTMVDGLLEDTANTRRDNTPGVCVLCVLMCVLCEGLYVCKLTFVCIVDSSVLTDRWEHIVFLCPSSNVFLSPRPSSLGLLNPDGFVVTSCM